MTSILKKAKKDAPVVGLEIEADSVAAAELTVNGEVRVRAAAVAPLPPGAFEDGEVRDRAAVSEALESLFAGTKMSNRVRLGIANQRVVVRTMRLPAIDDPAELDSAVRFTAQEQIAMPLDQAVLDHRVVGGVPAQEGVPPQVDVMVVAARRDMIAATLAPLRDAGLEPIGVDLAAFGMIRSLGHLGVAQPSTEGEAPEPITTLYCSVGDVTNLAIAKGRSCLFTRVSPAGLDDVAGSLSSAAQLSPEHARMWLQHVGLAVPAEQVEGDPELVATTRSTLEGAADSLLDELRLSIDFYGAQEGAVPIERVVLCGPGSAIPGLAERMEPTLGLQIVVGVPYPLTGYDAPTAARLTMPFGLALER